MGRCRPHTPGVLRLEDAPEVEAILGKHLHLGAQLPEALGAAECEREPVEILGAKALAACGVKRIAAHGPALPLSCREKATAIEAHQAIGGVGDTCAPCSPIADRSL